MAKREDFGHSFLAYFSAQAENISFLCCIPSCTGWRSRAI